MELSQIVDVINSSNCRVEGSTLFCEGYEIKDKKILSELEAEQMLEEPVIENTVGERIKLALSIPHLRGKNFFLNWDDFISKKRYQIPSSDFYLFDYKNYGSSEKVFWEKYQTVVKFIQALEAVSKHSYEEIGDKKCILHREDKSIFLSLKYSYEAVKRLNPKDILKLNSATMVLLEAKGEERAMLLNEIIEHKYSRGSEHSVNDLLCDFETFFTQFQEAFQYYLRNFSFNKLKYELDTKSLEYTSKISAIISEAQTKLIAIPSAFILVGISLDFTEINSLKNYVILLGAILFAVLLEVFILNQKAGLRLIEADLESYIDRLDSKVLKVQNKISSIKSELGKQKNRILLIEIILWTITLSIVLFWMFLSMVSNYFVHLIRMLLLFF